VSSQRVLLSGGTGLIGQALSQSQLAAGNSVLKLVRRTPVAGANEVFWSLGQPREPISDTADLARLEGCDFAVHLAGANLSTHRWTSSYKKTILDSRMDASHALLEILSRLKARPRVLVCASAIGIYGDRGDEILTETSAPGTGFLPDVCVAWEAVTEPARALGIRVVHLRFSVVLAAKGGAMEKLLPVFRVALGGQLGDGRQWTSWITLSDVVRAIEFCLMNDGATGAFNTTAPNPVTNAEFTRALAKAVHRPAPWIVPGFALRLLFGQMAQDTLLASTRALPARLEAMGFDFRDPLLGPALQAMLR
jgi:uncharacterized protein (TIGR01777 family)